MSTKDGNINLERIHLSKQVFYFIFFYFLFLHTEKCPNNHEIYRSKGNNTIFFNSKEDIQRWMWTFNLPSLGLHNVYPLLALKTSRTRASQEPVIAHLVFNLTSKVYIKRECHK